jgi:hypothetical protein
MLISHTDGYRPRVFSFDQETLVNLSQVEQTDTQEQKTDALLMITHFQQKILITVNALDSERERCAVWANSHLLSLPPSAVQR